MILVTGATGRSGTEVVKALLAKGQSVTALVRDSSKAGQLAALGVSLVEGDIGDPNSWSSAFEGADKVFLLSPESPDMREQHGKFAEAAGKAGVQHLLRMSIIAAMDPAAPLALAKWHGGADLAVAASGVPYSIIQPAWFMQNTIMYKSTIVSDGEFYGAMGDGKIGVIDTRDIAASAAVVLTSKGHEGKTYVLTGPESLSQADIAAKLSSIYGKDVRYVNVGPEQIKSGMIAMGMPDWMADAWIELAAMVAEGKVDMTTSAVSDLTGESPGSFDQFSRDLASVFTG